ncbi:DNM3B methyltransferase, partial [Pheucticus melanocephalus]|nr:DNM3B methyltransferase [Pheucticus melanocephalus]
FQDGKEFGIGELVWGKIKGFSWWPAIVVSHRATAKRQAVSGMRWVQWFGDGKFSEVRENLDSALAQPKTPSLHVSAPLLRLAVGGGCAPAAFQASPPSFKHGWALAGSHGSGVARSRSGKTFTTGPRESLEEQLKPMIDWAITGFKPLGLKGLRPPKGSGEVEEPWASPEAGGLSLRRFLFLAENGVLRNGTEEVVSLEQCPPTKRLRTYPCNSSKEQRVEEDQTREQMVSDVTNNSGKLEDSCLSCGRRNPATFHPLFKGGPVPDMQ